MSKKTSGEKDFEASLKELERIEGAGHLAQFDFRGIRNALSL